MKLNNKWKLIAYSKSNALACVGYTHFYELTQGKNTIEIRIRIDEEVQFVALSPDFEIFSFLKLADGQLLMNSQNNWGKTNSRCLSDKGYHADMIRFLYEDTLLGIEERDRSLIQIKIIEMMSIVG